jgi:hypothetical protein
MRATRAAATSSSTTQAPTAYVVDDLSLVGYGIRNTAPGGVVSLESTQSLVTVQSKIQANASDIELIADKMAINAQLDSGGVAAGTVTLKPFQSRDGDCTWRGG